MSDILAWVSLVSTVILSVGSICLSITFYRWSSKGNKETTEMQNKIKGSVENLQGLYDRTFEDIFDLVKSQMNAMQKHIFKSVGETSEKIENEDGHLETNKKQKDDESQG
jgi:hypothetical protein